jgi:hypothetical protein
MAVRQCDCGHAKRDHTILTSNNYGACKICLCNEYKAVIPAVASAVPVPAN